MTYARNNFPLRNPLLPILAWLWLAGSVAAEATTWRSSLYPANWTPPGESVPFASAKLIQDFSYAGYRRGEEAIPNIAGPVFDVTTYGADATGASDSTVAIQNAINAAAAAGGGVVFLPAGTYQVEPQGTNNFALRISTSNIVLRGAGTDEAGTFLVNTSYEMRSKAVIQVSPPSTSLGTTRNITGDLPGPTQRIPVENAGSFAPGNIVRLQWTFTDEWIIENNQQTWWNETNGRPGSSTYLREVTATNPTEGWIEIDVPTRYSMKTRDAANVRTISGQLTQVGIESLAIGNRQHPGNQWGESDYEVEGTSAYDTHASWLIRFQNVRDSWISDVHSRQAATNTSSCHMLSNGVSLLSCLRITVRNCEMRRPQYGGGGGNGYMVRIQTSNECLVKNSIADFSRHGFVISHGGTSGNVFFQCDDLETQRATGSTGSYTTGGSGSDNHMFFSHSNLWDQCHAHNSFYTAHHRTFSGTIPHGLTSAHGVYWNTSGSGTRYNDIVRSEQLHYGYVIGTSGTKSGATNPTGGNTAPADHLEGIGMGAAMEVPSLYTDQLAKRMQGILVDAGGNGFTASTSAYPLSGSVYTYGSAPVTTLWSQVSGPATALFADASSPITTVALPELGTYVLELSATDGSKSASEQVVIEVLLSTPRSAAHFIRGEAQNTDTQPLGYFTSASDIVGTSGASGSRDDRNVVLGYTLPALPVGSILESATFSFEITQGRDSTGDANLPELHVYLLDTENPAGSDLEFFHHGLLDPSQNAKRVGTTSVTISGTTDNNFPAGEQVRFFTLTGDALALLQSFYNGHTPTRSAVYFRFNLSVDPSINDFRRYRVNTEANGSSLYFKSNAVPSVNAGPDQTVTLDQSVPWTPAQLTTAAWYDAADPGTMTVQSGNAVSEWRDKSGNDNHASQATPSRMPASGIANIGGLNAISFDPFNDQHLAAGDHASLDLDASGGANVFAVFNYTGYVNRSSGLNSIVSKGALLAAGAAYGIRLNTNNTLPFKAGDGLTCTPPDAPASQDLIYSGTRDDAAMTARAYLNGIQRATASAAAISSDNASALVLGGELTTSRCADVRLGEVLIVPGLITADDRQKTEGYLAHKWSISANLPADHPYKDAAPVNSDAFAIAALDGSATDPENDPLTFSWSVVSGPGDVIFANASAPDSTATFSSVGTYVLRLTADDGFSTNSDEVTITVEAPFVEPKTHDVYLIAGQSNADGRGYTSDLTGGLAAYAGTQPDVRIFYVNPANSDPVNPTYNTGWTTLAPGYSVAPGFSGPLPSDRFGFEVSLAKALAAHDPDRNVAIIKITKGGTSLATDWDPAGGANYMWQTFANKVPEALAALTANGDIAEIRGMFWHQGESDGSNPTYQNDLVEFIAACRTLTGKADLPFAMGELERDDDTLTVKGRNYQLTAMANVADADPNAIMISSVGLSTYDGTHFTSPSYITFGERFATAFHDFGQGLNYSVAYDGNGSTGGNVPVDSRSYNSVASATVLGAGDLVRAGFNFTGWNTMADSSGTSYLPGSVFVITSDTTLHAQWTAKITPTVDPWPTAAPITQGQPLSSATLSGGSASVPGNFTYTNPLTTPPAGIYAAELIFTPEDTINYNTVQGIVNVTVRTVFESWAGTGDITFTGDANADGVADGMAWLLGASDPTINTSALLPTAIENDGTLEANFTMLNQAARGTAVVNLHFGTDLGTWNTVTIPEVSGTHGGVEFVITPNGALNHVVATIPSSGAFGGKLFVRLSGAEN